MRKKRRKLKGIEMGPNVMFSVFLAIGLGLFLFLAFSNTGGYFGELQEFFARLFGEDISPGSMDYKIAKASTESLTTALKCITNPVGCKCTGSSGCIFRPYSGIDATGAIIEETGPKDEIISLEPAVPDIPDLQINKENDANVDVTLKCSQNQNTVEPKTRLSTSDLIPVGEFFNCKKVLSEQISGLPGTIDYNWECKYCDDGYTKTQDNKCISKESLECTITNFQLPQSFEGTSAAKDWIDGFGDPLFVVYWQAFPTGEETDWSSMSAWYGGATTLTFGALCVFGITKGVKNTIKAGGYIVRSSADKTTSYIGSKFGKLTNVFKSEGTVVWESWIKRLESGQATHTRSSILNTLKSNFDQYAGKTFITESISKFKAAVPKTPAYTAAGASLATVDAYLAARLDSQFGMFFPDEIEPDSLMLQMPLKKREKEELPSRIIPVDSSVSDPVSKSIVKLNKPVMLNKEGFGIGPFSIGDEVRTLWLASPCKADLKISETEVFCSIYSYNEETGETLCEGPIKPSWFDRLNKFRTGCASLPNADKDMETLLKREAELIQDMDSVQIFNENGLIIDGSNRYYEIYDPLNRIRFYYDRNKGYVTQYSEPITSEGIPGTEIKQICQDGSCCGKVDINDDSIDVNFIRMMDETGFEASNMYLCDIELFDAINNEKSITYNLIGSLKDDGSLDKFFGLKLDFTTSGFTRSIFLKDFSTISVSQTTAEGIKVTKKYNFDGKIDEINDYLIDKVGIYISDADPLGLNEIAYVRSFVDGSTGQYDGITDSITSTNCNVRAMVVQVNKEHYEDKPNYCHKKNDMSEAKDILYTTGSIGVGVFTKAAKIGGPIGFALSTAVDCGIAIYDAKSEKSWPDG